jgi:hypothetical protein
VKIFKSYYLFFTFFLLLSFQAANCNANSTDPSYFLPENHKLKSKLDAIFSKNRATQDNSTLKKAGFRFVEREKWDQIIVATHSKLKGYLLKLYTDNQIGVPDLPMWIQRIEGARLIQRIIDAHGYQHMFKTPQKWIYKLPENPLPQPGLDPKKYIMIVEDMKLLDQDVNKIVWGLKDYMTEERLLAFYTILKEGGLIDSVFTDNTPVCTDERMAFIDTEHFNKGPIKYERLLRFLPPSRHEYWLQLWR